jgi:hypothetical protein
MDFLVAILWLLLELPLIFLGRLLVRCLTAGRWRFESLSKHEGAAHAAAGALTFVSEGRRVVTVTGQQFAGLLFLGCLLFGGFYGAGLV